MSPEEIEAAEKAAAEAAEKVPAPLQACTVCEWVGATEKCITEDGLKCLSCGGPVVDFDDVSTER